MSDDIRKRWTACCSTSCGGPAWPCVLLVCSILLNVSSAEESVSAPLVDVDPTAAPVPSDHGPDFEGESESDVGSAQAANDHEDAPPPPRVVHRDFRAPVRARHKLARYDWGRNPLLLRIHALCLQHTFHMNVAPAHTEFVVRSLRDDGLGPSALSEQAQQMLTYHTTDFRTYVQETIPRTTTSQLLFTFFPS